MKTKDKIVLITILGLVILSVFSVWLYANLGAQTQAVWLFYLIVVSAWTSFFGVAWALYGIYKFYSEVDKAKEQLKPEQLYADLKKEWDEIKPFFVWLKENRESFKRIIKGVDRIVGKFGAEPAKLEQSGQPKSDK